MRFDHRIQTQRLKNVHDISESDLATIDTAMTICSTWLPGHAQAMALNDPLPSPDDFSNEVQRLQDFTAAMRKRGRH